MATTQEIFDALKEMDRKNDEAHALITEKISALRVDGVKTETRVDAQEKRCDRRGAVQTSLFVGMVLAIVGVVAKLLLT